MHFSWHFQNSVYVFLGSEYMMTTFFVDNRHAIKWKLNVKGRGADVTSSLQDAHYLFSASISKGCGFNKLQLLLVVYGLQSQRQGLGCCILKISINKFYRLRFLESKIFDMEGVLALRGGLILKFFGSHWQFAPVSSPFLS